MVDLPDSPAPAFLNDEPLYHLLQGLLYITKQEQLDFVLHGKLISFELVLDFFVTCLAIGYFVGLTAAHVGDNVFLLCRKKKGKEDWLIWDVHSHSLASSIILARQPNHHLLLHAITYIQHPYVLLPLFFSFSLLSRKA